MEKHWIGRLSRDSRLTLLAIIGGLNLQVMNLSHSLNQGETTRNTLFTTNQAYTHMYSSQVRNTMNYAEEALGAPCPISRFPGALSEKRLVREL